MILIAESSLPDSSYKWQISSDKFTADDEPLVASLWAGQWTHARILAWNLKADDICLRSWQDSESWYIYVFVTGQAYTKPPSRVLLGSLMLVADECSLPSSKWTWDDYLQSYRWLEVKGWTGKHGPYGSYSDDSIAVRYVLAKLN